MNPTQVPVSGDNAVFDMGTAGYTVTFDDNETSSRLISRTDVATFDLGGLTHTLDGADTVNRGVTLGDVAAGSNRIVDAGRNGNGVLNIVNGAFVESNNGAYLGRRGEAILAR